MLHTDGADFCGRGLPASLSAGQQSDLHPPLRQQAHCGAPNAGAGAGHYDNFRDNFAPFGMPAVTLLPAITPLIPEAKPRGDVRFRVDRHG